jgi:hypothetical protein
MTSIKKSAWSMFRDGLKISDGYDDTVIMDHRREAIDMEHRVLNASRVPPPPAPTTVVEQTALQLNRALDGFKNQETQLVAEIAAKTELLRQVRASLLAVSTGLETLDGDPALGSQTVPTPVADATEDALLEELA